jgi:hypothetical protein
MFALFKNDIEFGYICEIFYKYVVKTKVYTSFSITGEASQHSKIHDKHRMINDKQAGRGLVFVVDI